MLLWDSEQIDAHNAGRPVPPPPTNDSEDDLLDRNEAAELAGVAPRTWDRYANLPGIQPRPQPIDVAGTEHWRRGDILTWLAGRPGPGTSPGRPTGSRETTPRANIRARTAELLQHEPAITAAHVAAELGITPDTAQRHLTQARTNAVSKLLRANPYLTALDIQTRLGYPLWAAERALTTAHTNTRKTGRGTGEKAAHPEPANTREKKTGPEPADTREKAAGPETMKDPGKKG
ncbi:helix-turn-helix transcriptional regulator [Streptomyces sp. NBC_01353]|uniref:helix-turn-helix transcriptional regulator n=1 Tax=Streptomyces sp. NBC_01353 TaxID=2903835 RepID=UPI002E37076E|nr:hypothetical protein [Streptomyces sp. NBC_01353]